MMNTEERSNYNRNYYQTNKETISQQRKNRRNKLKDLDFQLQMKMSEIKCELLEARVAEKMVTLEKLSKVNKIVKFLDNLFNI